MSSKEKPQPTTAGNAIAGIAVIALLGMTAYSVSMTPNSSYSPSDTCMKAARELIAAGRTHFPGEFGHAVNTIGYQDLRRSLAIQLESEGSDCLELTLHDTDSALMKGAAELTIAWLPHNW